MTPHRLRLVALTITLGALVLAVGPAVDAVYDGRSLLALLALAVAVTLNVAADIRHTLNTRQTEQETK